MDGRLGHGDHDALIRADAGRLDHGHLVVALDVLHQRAHRHPRLLRGQRDPFDPPYLREARPRRRPRHRSHGDRSLSLQLFCMDQGERYEWFDSTFITVLGIIAALTLAGFLWRELTAAEPILDLGVYRDRNFAASSVIMVFAMFGFFSSMVLLALFTQKVLGYDAWTSGLVLAPGGVGNLVSLIIAGRLINCADQHSCQRQMP
jgi:DHA2 family multidrug resistance protein